MRSSLLLTALAALLTGAAVATRADEPPPAVTTQPAPIKSISAADLATRLADAAASTVVVDVRTSAEFAAGHVPGAINLPYDNSAQLIATLSSDKAKPIVLYCRSGRRSGLAIDTLRAAGFEHLEQLEGNMPGWEAEGRPIER